MPRFTLDLTDTDAEILAVSLMKWRSAPHLSEFALEAAGQLCRQVKEPSPFLVRNWYETQQRLSPDVA